MSNKNQETIADIIEGKRREAQHIRENNDTLLGRGEALKLEEEADRIEAAHKREREAVAEAAQICGEIGEMVGRESSKNQSVTNCNRLGNAAKMRAALANIVLTTKKAGKSISCDVACGIISSTAKAAISAPPRNCDVGTVEEQIERFQRFCGTRPCDGCTLKNKVNETLDCAIHWAQMPYEEGGAK